MKKDEIGGKFIIDGKTIWIKRIINKDPATIVFWSDGTKTITKCSKEDEYDAEKGVLISVMKKIFGTDAVINLLKDWGGSYQGSQCGYGRIDRDLAFIRQKHKKDNKK